MHPVILQRGCRLPGQPRVGVKGNQGDGEILFISGRSFKQIVTFNHSYDVGIYRSVVGVSHSSLALRNKLKKKEGIQDTKLWCDFSWSAPGGDQKASIAVPTEQNKQKKQNVK